MIYLDYNASAPLMPEVLDGMLPWLQGQAVNPSSLHAAGKSARLAINQARAQIADAVGAKPQQVVFTSGATEANNLALSLPTDFDAAVITSAVEHPSIAAVVDHLATQKNYSVVYLPVDGAGLIQLEQLAATLSRLQTQHRHLILSIQLVNNETGVIQPWQDIQRLAQKAGALVHCDATQAVGRLPVNMADLAIDALTISAHKLGGPQGVGALIKAKHWPLAPLLLGGGQEAGMRSGTENVAGIVGFGLACALAKQNVLANQTKWQRYQTRIHNVLTALGASIIGNPTVANTLCFRLPNVQGETLVGELARLGIALSSGSACNSAKIDLPSQVLLALGLSTTQALEAVRISMGTGTTLEDVIFLEQALLKFCERLKRHILLTA